MESLRNATHSKADIPAQRTKAQARFRPVLVAALFVFLFLRNEIIDLKN